LHASFNATEPVSRSWALGDAIVDQNLCSQLSRRDMLQLALGAAPVMSGLGLRAARADAPRYGGTLIMAIDTDPPTVNPDVTTGVPDVSVGSLVYEALTRIDDQFRAVPSLAESWTVSPDNLSYTFKLITTNWHDGTPFTSKDVKFTLEEVSPKYGAKFRAAASHIKRITTPDDRTVVIELSSPFGPMLFSLSSYTNAAILPAHVFQGTDILTNPATLSKPIGTGPFMMKEWARGQTITLARNPHYWRKGLPYLDEIVFRFIPDTSARVLALKAGEVDYIYFYYFSAEQYSQIAGDKKIQVRERGTPEDHLIIWNTRRTPFDQVKVRQALFTAIDRDYIKKAVFQNLGSVMQGAIDSRIAWANDPAINLDAMYPYDPQKAAAMLDEAGLKAAADGKRFKINLVYDSADVSNERQAQVLQSMWHKIGVEVAFAGLTRNMMLPRVFTDWDFDATLQAYSTAGDPALGVSRLYVTSAIRKAPFVNASGYSNPEVDRLFAAGATAAAQAERAAAYKQVEKILAQDLPVFPIWQTALLNVASTRVQGKWAWSTGYDYWDEVWLKKGDN
jgi:peptide/nickel transport system substrate-binding protein